MWSLITNWKDYLLLSLVICLLLLSALLQRAWSEVAEKTAEIASINAAATQYKTESEAIAKEANDAYQAVVEQVKKDAYANYLAKYGRGNAACGVARGVLPAEHGVSEASSPVSADDPAPERVFVEACALDAATVAGWQQWARENDLPISKE